MYDFSDLEVSQAIFESYASKFRRTFGSDVVLVGAGPSGLVAAWHLAGANFNVVVLEKRLSPGGGLWGGGIGMNEIVAQEQALDILTEAGGRFRPGGRLDECVRVSRGTKDGTDLWRHAPIRQQCS
jgi:ribulose 1,5-bisphosphate synthetase/thiazole synthase